MINLSEIVKAVNRLAAAIEEGVKVLASAQEKNQTSSSTQNSCHECHGCSLQKKKDLQQVR
jgi:cytochrome c553